MENEYVALRNNYLPQKIKMVFILESPPSGGGYFYNPKGKVSEVLFRAMMDTVLKVKPVSKEEGLRLFAEKGYVLINPIYIPVDKLPDKEADGLIIANYGVFCQDLNNVIKRDKNIPIVIIKANVLRVLESKLIADGFNVINKGLMVPFPLHYHMATFTSRLCSLLQK